MEVSPSHKCKAKTVCTDLGKHLSRKPNINQSQSSNSALASLPDPRQ